MTSTQAALLFLRRAAVFVLAVAVLHLVLAVPIPLANERRHFAVPLAWALDWLLFVRPRLEAAGPNHPNWKRWIPSVATLMLALGGLSWALVIEGARRGGGWAGGEEWLWKNAIALSLLAHCSLLARALGAVSQMASGSRARKYWGVVLAALVMVPYGFTVLNVHRVKSVSPHEPGEVGLGFERVRFASGPLLLRGWWIPAARPTTRCILVCHGISANAGAFMGVSPFLHRAGFNILFFDFRGHGSSPGHTASFGWHEAEDVRAACKYLRGRGQNRIALYGFSMGGAGASLAFHSRFGLDANADAGFDSTVRAVVVDSTFARFAPLVEAQLGPVPRALRPGLMWALSVCSAYEIGVRPEQIAPVETVGRIAPRPVLIIHGDADRLIPLDQSRELFEAAREPKSRIVVHGAGHCLCRLVNPPPYEARVAAWLKRALH